MKELSEYIGEIYEQVDRAKAVTFATINELESYYDVLQVFCQHMENERLSDAITLLTIVIESIRKIESIAEQVEKLDYQEKKKAVTNATA